MSIGKDFLPKSLLGRCVVEWGQVASCFAHAVQSTARLCITMQSPPPPPPPLPPLGRRRRLKGRTNHRPTNNLFGSKTLVLYYCTIKWWWCIGIRCFLYLCHSWIGGSIPTRFQSGGLLIRIRLKLKFSVVYFISSCLALTIALYFTNVAQNLLTFWRSVKVS